MDILKILKLHEGSFLTFPSGTYSFGHFHDALLKLPPIEKGPFIWSQDWSPENFLGLLRALKDQNSIICVNRPQDEYPPVESGEVIFQTSGSEGEAKWVFHHQETFLKSSLLKIPGPVCAVLSPFHAAGFDLLMNALRQGMNLAFSDIQNLSQQKFKTLVGPPQVLGFLLSFSKSALLELDLFLSSGEALAPIFHTKKEALGLTFTIAQFYGTTETLKITTETLPHKPWQMSFDAREVSLNSGQLIYHGETLARSYWSQSKGHVPLKTPYDTGDTVEEEAGHFTLLNNRRHFIKIWGERVNLKRMEMDVLNLPGVIDAKIKAHTSLFGLKLHLHIWTNEKTLTLPEDLTSFTKLGRLEIFIHPPSELSVSKNRGAI